VRLLLHGQADQRQRRRMIPQHLLLCCLKGRQIIRLVTFPRSEGSHRQVLRELNLSLRR
jgi:hypothetical protein